MKTVSIRAHIIPELEQPGSRDNNMKLQTTGGGRISNIPWNNVSGLNKCGSFCFFWYIVKLYTLEEYTS